MLSSLRKKLRVVCCAVICLLVAPSVFAQQDLRAQANVITQESVMRDRLFGGVSINLKLSQPVPYRVFTLDRPYRVVVDFLGLDWNSLDAQSIVQSEQIKSVRFGAFQPGWTRMVLELAQPMGISKSSLDIDQGSGSAKLSLRLLEVSDTEFQAKTGMPDDARWRPNVVSFDGLPKKRQTGDKPLVVAIDAGHGGVDPGAVVGKVSEKDLVLVFVKELQERLQRSGNFEVHLTRYDDVFVGLNDRIVNARIAAADVFISFHADALLEGSATGITVYNLSKKASDRATQELATAMDRAELLAGVDLSNQDDQISTVLMDLARVETAERSRKLAEALSLGMRSQIGVSRRRPVLSADFAVLRAPDIPSVLVELGFMTNPRDLANLQSRLWRERVQKGIEEALSEWAIQDAVNATLLRQ